MHIGHSAVSYRVVSSARPTLDRPACFSPDGKVISLMGSWGLVGPACDTRNGGFDARRQRGLGFPPMHRPIVRAMRTTAAVGLPRRRILEGDKGQPCLSPASQAGGGRWMGLGAV